MAIADHLFPREDGANAGRIPVVGIVGTRNNAFIARLVGWLLQLSGKLTGVASEGMFLANRQTQKTNTANWAGAHRLLTNRLAEAAVIRPRPAPFWKKAWPMTAAWSAWSPTWTASRPGRPRCAGSPARCAA
jgi:hypothetical protein